MILKHYITPAVISRNSLLENLDKYSDLYEKYHDTYIELEGKWKGEVYSAHMDLSMNAEDILQRFSKTRRYEVRRAGQRDNLMTEFICDVDEKNLQSLKNIIIVLRLRHMSWAILILEKSEPCASRDVLHWQNQKYKWKSFSDAWLFD